MVVLGENVICETYYGPCINAVAHPEVFAVDNQIFHFFIFYGGLALTSSLQFCRLFYRHWLVLSYICIFLLVLFHCLYWCHPSLFLSSQSVSLLTARLWCKCLLLRWSFRQSGISSRRGGTGYKGSGRR